MDIWLTTQQAVQLMLSGDPALWGIVGVSFSVSLMAPGLKFILSIARGKTTRLKVLAGLQQPTTGAVNLQQSPWLTRLFRGQAQGSVIYMHQTPYMFDGTVLTNVCYGLKFAIRSPQLRRAEAINALRMVGLETLADEHVSVLSGGERQRVAMARDLLARGSSLVITSHQHNALTALCCRQSTISDTQLKERADLQLVKEENHEQAYA
ncbi:ATP-binding cassette domain-containing protein [Photobacterium sp. MCCC 1A19761]|uniref:ATP-binding cassette domain-containing protein n=1 Tax=Photobacterium sp. MCCC 1A19761 TaxID=3115000 RepID=UPI00307F9874